MKTIRLERLKIFSRLALWGWVTVSVSGCLVTRQELRGESPAPQRNYQTSQVQMQRQQQVRQTASTPGTEGTEDQLKELRNRLDQLEHQMSQQAAVARQQSATNDSDKRFRAYEEALKAIESQLAALAQEIQDLKKKENDEPKKGGGKSAAQQSEFSKAEDLFDKKQWQDAILSYQAYRDKEPKGKHYAEATYKIGVCFQELKMNDEAKVFFTEVASKYPNSNEARRATYRLKSIK